MPFHSVDLLRVRTYPLPYCQNRAALENLLRPEMQPPDFHSEEMEGLAGRIVEVRQSGCPSAKNAPWLPAASFHPGWVKAWRKLPNSRRGRSR